MARRSLKPKQVIEEEVATEPIEDELTADQVAAYLRQSTTKQTLENLESKELQLTGAQRYAVKQGLDADKIVIQWEGEGKRGVSGTKRIDEREKLRDTMQHIEAGKIKVVWAYSVSRLFRDKYGVQVGTFIETCAKHGVKVVIENAKVFDFSSPFDIMLFQFLANVAARENEDRAKLFTEAKLRKSMRGEYDGRPIPVGFIVDRTKTLPDGKPNPTYDHFIVYEPHAKVVRWLYKRYHELGGRFNLLAKEVVQMDVVFPDFEPWVSKPAMSRMLLEKVSGGYRISRDGLYNLLTAVEYMGYWKLRSELLMDADGKPLKVHEAVVEKDDWEYAWRRLSWTTLTGEPNLERANTENGWIPARFVRKTPMGLLKGILTSPLGTVQNSNGMYLVTERKNNYHHRINTLTVPTDRIDTIFAIRRAERLQEMERMGRGDFLQKQLAQMQETNKRALVSVDKQIARYRNEIAGIQAFIAATGAKADKKTLQEFNEKLLDARANLEALEAKKNAVEVEESSFETFVRRMQQLMRGMYGHEEDSRRFIELLCEKIELDEYSSHFVTLTIQWRVPFAQTDVCYIYRESGSQQQWSEKEEKDLAMLFPLADRKDIMLRFPKRSWSSILARAGGKGIARKTYLNTSGITDRNLSWRDYELLTQNSWCKSDLSDWKVFRRDEYWLYNVLTNSDVPTSRCGS